MSAINIRPELLEAGPVLQSKSKIRANQWGRLEQSRVYLILDSQYADYSNVLDDDAPFTFGASPPDQPGQIIYLQNHQYSKGGKAPSIGVVECQYVGAALVGSSEFATSLPFFRDHLTLSQVELFLYSGDATAGYEIIGTAQVDYYGIDQEFHYMSRAMVLEPLYLIDPYPADDSDPRHPRPTIRSIRAFTNANVPIALDDDWRVAITEAPLIFPDTSASVFEVFMTLSDLPRDPLRRSYLDAAGVSSGLWDVAEHFAIRMRAVVPDNLLGYAA